MFLSAAEFICKAESDELGDRLCVSVSLCTGIEIGSGMVKFVCDILDTQGKKKILFLGNVPVG